MPKIVVLKPRNSRNSDDSFSSSKTYLNWKKNAARDDEEEDDHSLSEIRTTNLPRKKLSVIAVTSKLRSAMSFVKGAAANRRLGTAVFGTFFGQWHGLVRFAFQENFKLKPIFLVALTMSTSVLLKKMATEPIRTALECHKKIEDHKKKKGRRNKRGLKILEEPFWRAYCNRKKCVYAVKRECELDEWKILNTVGPITMGLGVMPSGSAAESNGGGMIYMRAKFERVVGSNDCEAFYMINPVDSGSGGPELSIYLPKV